MKVVLLVCLLIAVVFGQTVPEISGTFSAEVDVSIRDQNGLHQGKGLWAIDEAKNLGLEKRDLGDIKYNLHNIHRYDLGNNYEVTANSCLPHTLTGSVPHVWSWLSLAKYEGSQNNVDTWTASIGYATLTVGVKSGSNTPVFFTRNSRGEKTTTYTFTSWSTAAPAASLFAVPDMCQTAQPESHSNLLGCVSGATAVARGKVWVSRHVPYNQGADYEGYREDCSGFVSMCWESAKPGHVTTTFYQIAHRIAKSQLRPGDCLLYAAEHVVLFGGWTNSAQTEYQAYEETRPGEGTVTRPTPYPYWYSQNDFLPYRYNSIC